MASIVSLPITHRVPVTESTGHVDGAPVNLSADLRQTIHAKIEALPTASGTVHHYDSRNTMLISLRVADGQVIQWSMCGPCDLDEAAQVASNFDVSPVTQCHRM